jgi:glycine betaine/choline ABC-type transport system substrate-binding protein
VRPALPNRGETIARRLLAALALVAAVGCRPADRVVVGSKNFGEQVLLGEIVAQTIEQRTHLPVERRLNLGGTFVCDRAIRAGEIDVYVEYTGTAFTAILKQTKAADRTAVLDEVRRRYGAEGLEWTAPLGFENTFAIVMRGDDADRLRVSRISDLAAHPELRAAFGYEFMERADGFTGLAKAYGLAFREPAKIMELGLLYRALVDKQADVVAGNSTDGVIPKLGLRVLEDDRHYFPPYDAVPVVRRATLDRHPEIRAALDALGGSISADHMRQLNYRVDGERIHAERVASEFVAASLTVPSPDREPVKAGGTAAATPSGSPGTAAAAPPAGAAR